MIQDILYLFKGIIYYISYGNLFPPRGTDWIGYEVLIEYIRKKDILKLDGDLVEIGTFFGGGAYKLAKYIERNGADKKLITIDVFDPEFDSTVNTSGDRMSSLYKKALESYYGKSQWEIFHSVTEGCSNIVVLKVDSKDAVIPAEKICFGFIDGNHDPEYVRNDFRLIWGKLSSGGCLAFHDYGGDLPETTTAIDELLEMYAGQIFEMDHRKSKDILFIRKK